MCRAFLCVVFLGVFLGACELNESVCQVSSKYGELTISIEPRPIKPMVESTLIVKGLEKAKEPKIHIYGITMYLGHLKENLEKNKNGDLEAAIMIAPCDEVEMVFSLEIIDGDEVIAQTKFTTFQ